MERAGEAPFPNFPPNFARFRGLVVVGVEPLTVAHNLKVAGSNPAPAPNLAAFGRLFCWLRWWCGLRARRPSAVQLLPFNWRTSFGFRTQFAQASLQPRGVCPYPHCAVLPTTSRRETPLTGANGGEGGIRTHGTLSGTPDFESGTIDHSATSPWRPTDTQAPAGKTRETRTPRLKRKPKIVAANKTKSRGTGAMGVAWPAVPRIRGESARQHQCGSCDRRRVSTSALTDIANIALMSAGVPAALNTFAAARSMSFIRRSGGVSVAAK